MNKIDTMKYRDLPPTRAWIIFESAGRLGSFTAAAAELGIGQPAVSHQIVQLEESLGLKLFTRRHRGVALTREGRRLLEAVDEGFGRIAETVATLRGQGRRAHLYIGADYGFTGFWLLPRLGGFRARHPQTVVRVVSTQAGYGQEDESLDVEIGFGANATEDDSTMLFPEEVVAVCSPALLPGGKTLARAEDLFRLTLLHLEEQETTTGRWFTWEPWLEAVGFSPAGEAGGLSFNTFPLTIQAALAGQGVALGWRPLVDSLLAGGQLVQAVPLNAKSERGYQLRVRAEARRRPEVAAFLDWLSQEAETKTTGPEGRPRSRRL
ncbi:MAG: LysR substrate-binding domain-containing protein [Rhodovibrionaceae bacterium]